MKNQRRSARSLRQRRRAEWRLRILWFAAAWSVVVPAASAELCAVDAVPAATLLVPYFEVDLGDEQGVNTLFAVSNSSPSAVLVHVTLWTDWSIPTIDFDLYLTGYDVQSFNLRDLFAGTLPQTSPSLSNRGALSSANSLPPGCSEPGDLPIGDLPQSLIDLITQAHSGRPVTFPGFDGDCAGRNHGDDVARGYITLDVVLTCSVQFPSSPGYFGTIAGFDNVLWGDVLYVEPRRDRAYGSPAAHIEAAPAGTFQPGDYTFYGRYVGFDASDRREPLATTFALPFVRGGGFNGGTDVISWRDSKQVTSPISCGPTPFPFPLVQSQIVLFDEEENVLFIPPPPPISPVPPIADYAPFALETQRVEIDLPVFPITADAGWMYLNLNTYTGAPVDPISQAWVMTLRGAEDRYGVGMEATALYLACDGADVVLP